MKTPKMDMPPTNNCIHIFMIRNFTIMPDKQEIALIKSKSFTIFTCCAKDNFLTIFTHIILINTSIKLLITIATATTVTFINNAANKSEKAITLFIIAALAIKSEYPRANTKLPVL